MKIDTQKIKSKSFIAIIIGIVVISIIIAVVIGKNLGTDKTDVTTAPNSEAGETVDDIVVDVNITEPDADVSATAEAVKVITLEEPKNSTNKPNSQTNMPQQNTVKPAEPVTQKPSPGSQGTHTEIIENGNDSVNEYSCGSARHHCDSKETHIFVVGLEQKGCPYCGSHSCKSFYSVDEWGNACYDPIKCEKYSAKNDASEYCQECGKKCGTGSNGTCVRFTVDTTCPECGKKVSGKTCHSH